MIKDPQLGINRRKDKYFKQQLFSGLTGDSVRAIAAEIKLSKCPHFYVNLEFASYTLRVDMATAGVPEARALVEGVDRQKRRQ